MNSNTKKVGFLITARLKSTRLPKKLLLEIKGKPVIEHLIDRIKRAHKIDEIIICTSTNEQDKPLGKIAKDNNIQCFFGDPDDVLLRLLNAAEEFDLDYIVNITADNPFVDPEYADKIIEKYFETDADLIRQFDLPLGAFSYGIKVDALRKVVAIKDSNDTEVWGRYFTDTGLFNVLDLDVDNVKHRRPGLRMTLDYPEDFDFFKAIFEALYVDGQIFSLDAILDFLDKNPGVLAINEKCTRKFKKRLVSQSQPKLKKTNKVERVLVIGSDPIGQRHIRNLKTIGIKNILTLRTKEGDDLHLPEELEIMEVDNWRDALKEKPDVAIIVNSPSLHLETAAKIAPYVKGILIEIPLSQSTVGCQELMDVFLKNRVVGFVGHNIMFHPVVKNIKRYINENDVGEIINFQSQVGQRFPDWHPNADYTKVDFKKELENGVSLTFINEIQLALELAGLPIQVSGMISHYPKLELDVDVCSNLMIKHKSDAVSQIHLDYLQNPPHRNGIIAFENGWINYSFSEMRVTGQQIKDTEINTIWSDTAYDYNQIYVDQMKEFIRYVEEERIRHNFDLSTSLESLKVVEALFESDRLGKQVNIKRNERFSF